MVAIGKQAQSIIDLLATLTLSPPELRRLRYEIEERLNYPGARAARRQDLNHGFTSEESDHNRFPYRENVSEINGFDWDPMNDCLSDPERGLHHRRHPVRQAHGARRFPRCQCPDNFRGRPPVRQDRPRPRVETVESTRE